MLIDWMLNCFILSKFNLTQTKSYTTKLHYVIQLSFVAKFTKLTEWEPEFSMGTLLTFLINLVCMIHPIEIVLLEYKCDTRIIL